VRIAPEVQAIFRRRRHQPRRPPHTKIKAGKAGTGDWAARDLTEKLRPNVRVFFFAVSVARRYLLG